MFGFLITMQQIKEKHLVTIYGCITKIYLEKNNLAEFVLCDDKKNGHLCFDLR